MRGIFNEIIRDASAKKHRFLPIYHKLKAANTDYVINYGSGGSGKSYLQAVFFVKKITSRKRKLVVLRKKGVDIAESVHSQFVDDALPFWGLKEGLDYKLGKPDGKYRITFPLIGSKIVFRGVDDPERFKSINKVTDLWIEEASEFTEDEFKIISDRIRGEKVNIYLTFNPISENHWLKKRFFDTPNLDKNGNSRVTIIFSTYKENPFVGEKFLEDMSWYEKYDPDHYEVYGLGKWGVIKSKNPFIRGINYNTMFGSYAHLYRKDLPVYFSLDFNEKWTCTVKQIQGTRKIYLESIHEEPEILIEYLAVKYGSYETIVTGDASGRAHTQYTSDESKASAWSLFKSKYNKICAKLYKRTLHMQEEAYFDESHILSRNFSYHASRTICNALIIVWAEKNDIVFDKEGCRSLENDLKRVPATVTGGLNKTDLNKKNIGHWFDTFRYDLCCFHFEEFENLGLYEDLALYG